MPTRRRWILSQPEVQAIQWMARTALLVCLCWSIYVGAWQYVAGNVIVLMVTWRPWRA